MKYSNYIGCALTVLLIASCFVPWVYIESVKTVVTGLHSGNTNFGSPGVVHIFLAILSIILFFINKIWAKRANLFVTTLNFAWAIRNFLVLTLCEMGECPERRLGIYAMIILSFLILVMALLPKMNVED